MDGARGVRGYAAVKPMRTMSEIACGIVYAAVAYGTLTGLTTLAAYNLYPWKHYGSLKKENAGAFIGAFIGIYTVPHLLTWFFYLVRPSVCRTKTLYVRARTVKPFDLVVAKTTHYTDGALEDDWTVEPSNIGHSLFVSSYIWAVLNIAVCVSAWADSLVTGVSVTALSAVLTFFCVFGAVKVGCFNVNDVRTEQDELRLEKAKARYARELTREYEQFVKSVNEEGKAFKEGDDV